MSEFVVEQRGEDCFAVLEPNRDAGKQGVCYAGAMLTVCTTDGIEDAAALDMEAAARAALEALSGMTTEEFSRGADREVRRALAEGAAFRSG